jgi:hypothetical protein
MIFGGCEGNKVVMGMAAAFLIVAILVLFYVWQFAKDKAYLSGEGFCGGMDKGCMCNGNEMMTAQKIVTNNDLTKILSGQNI